MVVIVFKLNLFPLDGWIFGKEAIDRDLIVIAFENTVCIRLEELVPKPVNGSFES